MLVVKENAKPQVVISGNIHSKDVSDSIKSTSFQEVSQWLDKELKKKKYDSIYFIRNLSSISVSVT